MQTNKSWPLLALIAIAAVLTVPLQADAQFRYEEGVYDRLAQLGIGPEDVTELNVYPFPDPNDQFGGARAWVKVDQCPEGWVVMTLGRTGHATFARTRDGCMLPGLD
jgi:hypothetical protein